MQRGRRLVLASLLGVAATCAMDAGTAIGPAAGIGGIAHAAGSGGGGGGMSGDVGAAASPRELARTAHNDGMRFKRRAQRMEEEAAEAGDDAARQEAQRQARENWGKAIAAFRQSFSLDPKAHKSLNELGYALRRVGEFAAAVQAYDAAIAMKPDFGEAIEYRAEAYLALGRLDDVKAAYLRLVELDDDLAAMLLAAMQAWSGTRSGDTSEAVQAFRAWIAERAALARYVGGDAPDWRA